MGLTTRKRYPNRVNRRRVSGLGTSAQLARRTPIAIVAVDTVSTTVTRITFDQVISLMGVPQYLFNGTTLGTAAVAIAPNDAIEITHPVTVVTTVDVPFEDPAVRNTSGGYVNPGQSAPG